MVALARELGAACRISVARLGPAESDVRGTSSTRSKTMGAVRQVRGDAEVGFWVVCWVARGGAINVFDVKDGYWNCPLFYDETDPDSARNNSRRLTAVQSECGEWQFKCLPQGLSCSGPYFQAWLTRIFRKYNIVLGQVIR